MQRTFAPVTGSFVFDHHMAAYAAVEVLADAVSSEIHPLIAASKDAGAAAVLIAAAGAVVTGLFVLGPPLLRLINP